MTDPNPTRAEVVLRRLRSAVQYPNGGGTLPSADTCHEAADMIQALRERAEAAEAERDRQYDENVHRIAMQARAENERDEARRAEVEALAASLSRRGDMVPSRGYMHEEAGFLRALAAENQALRERAEAAERAMASMDKLCFDRLEDDLKWAQFHADLITALTAARRAEAAAWNDAIEAAAAWHQSEIARLKEQVIENNAYTARVGAASYENDANRYCNDQIFAHQQSIAAIRALRRAAPTEGEA